MSNTGFKWGSFATLQDAVVLTQGGTTTNESAAVSLDVKAGCEVSIVAAYSNHAKATSGLTVYVLRSLDGTNYEAAADGPFGFEMAFLQNGTRNRVFAVAPGQVGSFKILLSWGNTTSNSAVTVTTRYRTADIPAAS